MANPGEHDRQQITGPDGRQLDILLAGPPDGMPLVFHNGTPAGLVLFEPMVRAAAERGLRTIGYTRPGYGGSTPQPGRRVADAAADVAGILDHLGAARFVTVGWSGGGPHALACAALLPGRCLGAVSMAGVAPRDAAGLDWLDGMSQENIEEFTAAVSGEPAMTTFLAPLAGLLGQITAGQLITGMGGLLSAADRAVVGSEFGEYQAASFRAALTAGIDGWRDDDLAFARDWGFGLADCAAAPLAVWQGDQDRMVPAGHGQWLAAHLPGARAHLLPGEGHLTLGLTSYGRILDDLIDMAGLESARGVRSE